MPWINTTFLRLKAKTETENNSHEYISLWRLQVKPWRLAFASIPHCRSHFRHHCKKTLCGFWGSNTLEIRGSRKHTPIPLHRECRATYLWKDDCVWVTLYFTMVLVLRVCNYRQTSYFLNIWIPWVPIGDIYSYFMDFYFISFLIHNFLGSNYVLVLE